MHDNLCWWFALSREPGIFVVTAMILPFSFWEVCFCDEKESVYETTHMEITKLNYVEVYGFYIRRIGDIHIWVCTPLSFWEVCFCDEKELVYETTHMEITKLNYVEVYGFYIRRIGDIHIWVCTPWLRYFYWLTSRFST